MIMLHSTNLNAPQVDFKEAILTGQAPDRGLYMLNEIPRLDDAEMFSFSDLELTQIAYKVLSRIIGDLIPKEQLESIINSALNFEIPIHYVSNHDYMMYIDQGPTCSFKDVGARMLARLMEYFLEVENKNVIIITATSGDTGGAVAQAFYEMNRIQVVVLYPKNEVSNLQRKQMTTLGKNVTAIGINGKFDDCQKFAKNAFADKDLDLNLTSANSINFGRLLPQTLYYFLAYSRVAEDLGEKVIFSVPSGNFGNLLGGLIAFRMGLPVKKFIAAVNENDEFPRYVNSGTYQKVEPSKNCLSSAMNVGHPSNLARLIEMYGGQIDEIGIVHKDPDLEKIRDDIYTISITDELTKQTIKGFYESYSKIIEPHGAVGWAGLQAYRTDTPKDKNVKSISIETADPAKFPEAIVSLINITPKLPQCLEIINQKEEFPNPVEINTYEDFKKYLQSNY
ncbi:threonine synthase [Candidatus Borrarchaeum sp.]|uniref:threonine synthase n=1 Tax=Candidatus Borrarchaeum sp. TaxID=2846742 RepID=UPI00257D50F6|nr:threonine synthase [Candidatus Borrarchaeum sp.]